MMLDTSAQCNVLPYALYCKLAREKMKSKTPLLPDTGHKIPEMGKATLDVKLRGKTHPVEFQIIEHPATPVIVLTFNTTFGRYRYLRMPFGINSDPGIRSFKRE